MRVLLTPPTYYQIEYVINPWMDTKNKVDPKRAMEEWEGLVEIYKKIGLDVVVLDAQPGLPDMIYAANHGFVIDDIFIKANFRYEQRREEADFAEKLFKNFVQRVLSFGSSSARFNSLTRNLNSDHDMHGVRSDEASLGNPSLMPPVENFEIKTLPSDIFFEGQGDLFYRDGKFYSGYGKRTAKEAIPYLEKILDQEIITFEVNDPYYYHLDTCFAPLGGSRVIINPASFSKKDYAKIKKEFRTVIETSKEDNKILCCNLVCQNGAIVVGKGISKSLRHELTILGYEVIETPMSEMLKGGGSVKCLTLEFFQR